MTLIVIYICICNGSSHSLQFPEQNVQQQIEGRAFVNSTFLVEIFFSVGCLNITVAAISHMRRGHTSFNLTDNGRGIVCKEENKL